MSANMRQEELSIAGVPFFPTIGLKVTNRCSMRCPFCCEPDRLRPDADINVFRNIITRLADAGTKRLCITGGEPLMYPELLALLTHSHRSGLENVLLTANGRRLVECKHLLNHVNVLRFSVHGPEAVHDAIVGKAGSHASIQEAVSVVNGSGVLLAVTTVVTPQTLPHVYEVAEWCWRSGINRYYLFGVMPSGLGAEYSLQEGSVPDNVFAEIATELSSIYDSRGMRVITHPYRGDAECILVYGNGDVIVDPYHATPPYQLKIGNILHDEPQTVLSRLRSLGKSWSDCVKRFERSTII